LYFFSPASTFIHKKETIQKMHKCATHPVSESE
jgi:hypothetical protein